MLQRAALTKKNTLLRDAFVFAAFFSFSSVAFASEVTYVPLVGIPGLTDASFDSLPAYINAVYFFAISLGALYGVERIAFEGMSYATSDIISSKEAAKKNILGILTGLLILILPYVVLSEINPELLKLDILRNVSGKGNLLIPDPGSQKTPSAPATKTLKANDSDSGVSAIRAQCESVPGNTWVITPPDSGKCTGPTTKTQTYAYGSATEKENAISACKGISGTPTDKPDALSGGGVIECSFTSHASQVPI